VPARASQRAPPDGAGEGAAVCGGGAIARGLTAVNASANSTLVQTIDDLVGSMRKIVDLEESECECFASVL
jgi:hypothetical protein